MKKYCSILCMTLVVLLLSGCGKTLPNDSGNPLAINPAMEDVSMGLATQSVSFDEVIGSDHNNDSMDQYSVTTHAFDASISDEELDQEIINRSADSLRYQSDQPQLSTNVKIRSVSMCFLQSSSNKITRDTSTSGLQYRGSESTGWNKMVDGAEVSIENQTLILTIKNTTSDLIQFSGASNCGPISPNGYARWYIARPMIDEVKIQFDYPSLSGVVELNSNYYYNSNDTVRPPYRYYDSQSFPLATNIRLEISTTGNSQIQSGFIQNVVTKSIKQLVFNSGIAMFDTKEIGLGTHIITLQDQRGSSYMINLLVYNTIKLSPISLDPMFDNRGYYRAYRTQNSSIKIDEEASNKLLARQYSGVTIASDLWFNDCSGGQCFGFDLQVQSGQKVGQVTVLDQFGISGTVDLGFSMGAIRDSLKSATVRGGGINMLTQGVWDNAIQVDVNNIVATTKLFYYPCEWKPQQDISRQLDRAGYDNGGGTKYARLEDLLFVCDQSSINQTLTSPTQRYRDPRTVNSPVPKQLSTSKAFAVKSEYTRSNASQLFVQTQIGIYVKQSDDQATVWLFDLQSGQPISGSATLQLYQYSVKGGRTSSGTIMISSRPYVMDTLNRGDLTALTAQVGSDRGFVTLGGSANTTSLWNNDRGIDLQSSIRMDEVTSDSSIQTRGSNSQSRIYGYTDRGLYKPGDQLFVAGWVRKMADIGANSTTATGMVSIEVHPASDRSTTILMATGLRLDAYGGFQTSFEIPSDVPLNDYVILMTDPDGVTYTQTIKINEYQKPSFFINQQGARSGDSYIARINPQYYFGSPVQGWTYITQRSLDAKDRGWWWRDTSNTSDYYYDMRLEYRSSTSQLSNTIAGGGSDKPVSNVLFGRDDVPSQPVRLKLTTTITDTMSNETHTNFFYDDIAPEISIGLKGQAYERYYASTIKDLDPIGYILSGDSKDTTTTYTWYYFDRSQQAMTKGVDGSLYYNGQDYKLISSGSLTKDSGNIPISVVSKPGDRLLIVQTYDRNGKEIGHNEKSIRYADGQGYNYGGLNNNYTLTVSIDQVQYDEGQSIPINIAPYIKGATVLVTVEQGNRIVDSYLIILDGSQISIPAKKSYYPSAVISVTQIAGYDVINQSASNQRREPRMRQGYSQAKINQDLFKLNIDIQTDKDSYLPGEQVTLTVKTTDYQGKSVDARVSVGVVDKSLNDLYSYFKSPLSDFFLSLGSTIINYTNMKWLYQGLKVVSSDGSKGGGGGGRNPLGFLRQKFEDVAYWRGGVYTKDGIWTTTFTLPDNLTTWTIDAIGITKDSKVGTITRDIVATKDLIIQPNLPLYVTIGDRIDVPVKVLGITDGVNSIKNKTVTISGTISTIDGQIISIIDTSSDLNSSVIVPLVIDPKRYQYHDVIITLDAKIGDYRDQSRQMIPLRTRGLTQQQLQTSVSKQGSQSFKIPSEALNPTLNISIGQIPLVTLSNQLDYMIHYPYGCAEQTISSIAAILTAKNLTEQGVLTGYFSGDMVIPAYNDAFSLTQAVVDAKTRLWRLQSPSGAFGYWANTPQYYTLSVYIYGTVMQYPVLYQGYETQLKQLERYLDTNGGAANPEQYLYYLYYKSKTMGGVNLTQVQQIIDNDLKAQVAPVLLGAGIAYHMGDLTLARTRFDRLNIDDFDGKQTEYGSLYPLLTPRSALQIYQSLISSLASIDSADLQEELIVSLLRQRDNRGLWGNSTVDNLAVLKMIGQYQGSRGVGPVTCDITYGTQTQQFIITSGSQWSQDFVVEAPKDILKWSCNKSVIVDSQMEYVVTGVSKSMLTQQNVEYLKWTLPINLTIGQMGEAIAEYKITQASPHTAIELYVPSIYKLSDIINAKQTNGQLPFTIDGGYGCQPSHYEVRFDQLFLYYDTLEPNQSCRISISILKAYAGTTISMPTKLYQMYDDSVFATVMPVFK